MAKENKNLQAAGGAKSDPTGLYEVACAEIEIDALICYRTHRMRLPKSKADAINQISPGALKPVGI